MTGSIAKVWLAALLPYLVWAQNTSSEAITVQWLGKTAPAHHYGTTFGLPWARGKHQPSSTRFAVADGRALQSWINSYWPDGSIKWTGHAIAGADTPPGGYTIVANTTTGASTATDASKGMVTANTAQEVVVNTGKLKVSFAKTGSILVRSIQSASGKTSGRNGRLVLHSQSGVAADADDRSSIERYSFQSNIENVTVSEQSSVRALVTVRGTHQVTSSSPAHASWLSFVLRFYLYAGSDSMRVVHSIVFDGDAQKDFITGIGIKFDVPLAGEQLYDRHVRLAGVDGGLLAEAVKGITGLRRDPGSAVRRAQFNGQRTPNASSWGAGVTSRLHWVPDWNDYSLTQLSPDGFTVKKRTKAGQAWVSSTGGTRSGGLAYLGGATVGGLAVGMRDFWKRFPTGLDISNAATDTGTITLWIYSPAAQPLDLRPFHDGLGQETYADQLDALEITYEDWEAGFNTPYGIARTNEIFVFGFDATPSRQTLSELATGYIHDPPVLVASPETYKMSGAIGAYWSLPGAINTTATSSAAKAAAIERNLDFLFSFYASQVEQRRWYGFLDYGDFMHTYDADRHTWRYDVGGYGWDNSELSPDIFFWLQFLRTGRKDVYRFAEAQVRHGGEVDVYHVGKWKGLGTRHGVQHFSDSAKQARISTPQYRKIFYFVSGGDERTGELLEETLDADMTFAYLDPRRKVRGDSFVPSVTAAEIGLGTDWGALAAGWLIEVERRGTRYAAALRKLNATMAGIGRLKFGFVTGAGTYDTLTGELGPPPNDRNNAGVVGISHLSAVFGLVEVIHEITEHFGGIQDRLPAGFEQAWLDYCVYYGASGGEQAARYGRAFSDVSLRQGHSRLTAYAARRLGNQTLAARAWREFYGNDGLAASLPWRTAKVNVMDFVGPAEEASWFGTNDVGLYGPAAIENLELVPGALEGARPN